MIEPLAMPLNFETNFMTQAEIVPGKSLKKIVVNLLFS